MKIGAAMGCFTTHYYAPPYEEAVRTIGEMGFDGVELIAFTSEDLNDYYTRERNRNLKGMIDGYGMQLSEFILYAYAVVGLLSEDAAKRLESLDFFGRVGLADLGIYPISMFTYLFGPVDTVYGKTVMLQKARTSLKGEPIVPSVEDNAAVIMSWDSGLQATLRTNWCTAADKSVCSWDFRIYGSKGVIYINFSDEEKRVVVFSPYKALEGEAIEYLGFGNNYVIKTETADLNVDILEAFLDAVDRGEPFADDGCSITRQAHLIEIIESVYESSKSGREMKIKTKF